MRALVCKAPGDLELQDRPEPESAPEGWALVAVSHVGICGTDFHIFEGKHPFLNYPRIMGHEVSGTILATGAGVHLAAGQRVIVNPYLSCGKCTACRKGKPNCCMAIQVLGVHRDGAMCERILVPGHNLYAADGLSREEAAGVEFLAIGAHAVRRSLGEPGARTLVVGAGPIGLGTALFARIAGYDVTLLDLDAERLAFAARDLGFSTLKVSAENGAETVRDATRGEGFDLVFDASGSTRSIGQSFSYVAHGGALVMVSVVNDAITFSDPEFHKREMMLIGSRNATREDFDHVVLNIRNGRAPLSKLITHRTTLSGAATDIAHWTREKKGLIKAVIKVSEAG
jgi:2-desacetyl-2-hydroxyethyl bacteriochlorophyllide A dehydrogenase